MPISFDHVRLGVALPKAFPLWTSKALLLLVFVYISQSEEQGSH